MMRFAAGAVLLVGLAGWALGANEARQEAVGTSTGLWAHVRDGVVVKLTADGRPLAAFDGPIEGFTCLHRIDGEVSIGSAQARTVEPAKAGSAWRVSDFTDLPGTHARTVVTNNLDEVVITQDATCPQKGLWGVEWSIAGIPLERNIIVPGHSGVRLTRETPGTRFTYDYPMSWEAQLVLVEGAENGFYVWAQDPENQFKRLVVERNRTGWRLRFISMAYAPFEENAAIRSPAWRLGVYEGDWRVPARKYRDWMVQEFGPTRVEDQEPAWIKDMRCVVIMGLNLEVLENLAKTLDPMQTIIYVPSWRSQGYDRDYPDYDEVYDGLKPFIDRAHALGFRIMLHVNYFGVDPLNALYEQFEPYQVRSPWGSHEKEWWLWTRAEPEIKFAYINPACKAWRDLFTERMVRLCTDYDVDALHLDQTLCIYNDHNGRIDGMTMAEGNIALHQQLREALPDVALSGEGLNEVTYRHEAFAQRHAWGLYHADGAWDRALLAAAHPISSYLLRPYTVINGYLGYAPPTSGQLYAAWNEAYEHWGVIPTLKPSNGLLDHPEGFVRQFHDEVSFWFRERPEIAMDDPWPHDVAFPFRAASGERVVRTTDHQLRIGDRVISRTISDITEAALPGTIPEWQAYDETRLFGLDTEAWYPYFDEPRDLSKPHVAAIPEDFRPVGILLDESVGIVRTEQRGGVVADIPKLLEDAQWGSRHLDGTELTHQGDELSADGAFFRPHGTVIHAHPPWKSGTGETYSQVEINLPESGDLHFETTVGMDSATAGQTDGVTFSVRAAADGEVLENKVHTDSDRPVPLNLDLSGFAGRTITLELAVHPGPDNNPTYDWARWYDTRIVQHLKMTGTLELAGAVSYLYAAAGGECAKTRRAGPRLLADVPFPGPTYFIGNLPTGVSLPLDMARQPFETVFLDSLGRRLDTPKHATARPEGGQVNGVTVTGLFVHPPNEGRTVVVYTMQLPAMALVLETSVGLRDGADESNGVECTIDVNGLEMAQARVLPGDDLLPIRVDLARWPGKPVVVALVTDSAGPYNCDWVMWASPRIREAP